MRDRLQTLRLFERIARLGSFSQGARASHMSQPSASRLIARLEQDLGVRLFLRSGRALALTEPGATYLARIHPILHALDEADDDLRRGDDLRGTLRIGASTVVASQTIVPTLGAFVARYPELAIEVVADDRRQDLLRDGIDVAVRFGVLPDSGMKARLIGRWPLVVAAAADFACEAGPPDHPNALRGEDFLIAGPAAGRELVFRCGDECIRIVPTGRLTIGNSIVAVEAAKAGLGLCVATLQTFEPHFRSRELVRLVPAWSLGDVTAHAVYPGGQAGKPAARAFVEHLIAAITRNVSAN